MSTDTKSTRKNDLQIKGIRDGLLISLNEGEWSELEAVLLGHIDRQGDFLKGAKVTLDVGPQKLGAADLGHLRDKLSERGITLWAVLSRSSSTEITAQNLGLATRLSKPKADRTIHTLGTDLTGEDAVFVKRTLRSGHSLRHTGHIIVLGDVNPGAEIVAGGNVLVWGRLRGTVHAGAQGDSTAVICALEFSPTQVRIADQINVSERKRRKTSQPEVAKLDGETVVISAWDRK